MHVLTYGFTPEQETILNKKRGNIYDFLRYATEHNIPVILPHPLYFYTRNEHINLALFEKLACRGGFTRKLLQAQATVVAVARTPITGDGEATRNRRVVGRLYPIIADVADPSACERAIGETIRTFGRLDALVFTAGVGEHSDIIRGLVCQDLEHLGLVLDRQKNEQGKRAAVTEIHSPDSASKILIISTNEELEIATQTKEILG